jgi:hypothetical protein
MANVNPQAVSWANTRARVLADLLESAYLSCKKYKAEWDAQGLSAVIPNDATLVADGSAVDGRPPCKNSTCNDLYTRATDFITWYEGGSGPTVTGGGTFGVANTVRAIEVNGRSQF